MTVDELRNLLDEASANGHGDKRVFIPAKRFGGLWSPKSLWVKEYYIDNEEIVELSDQEV